MTKLSKFLLCSASLLCVGAIAYAQSIPGVGSNFPVTWNMVWENTTPKASFAASFSVVPAASATDIVEMIGSSTRTIRVRRVRVNGVAATAVNAIVLVVKRAALDDGNAITVPITVYDTGSQTGQTSATAVVEKYQANPTEPASATNAIILAERFVGLGNYTTAQPQTFDVAFAEGGGGVPVLRGAAQTLAINLGGIQSTGETINVTIEWTEE